MGVIPQARERLVGTQARNFAALVHHGTFLAGATALGDPSTLLPAFVGALSDSAFVVGLMTTILVGGEVAPQLLFSHRVEESPVKKPYLLAAVYTRALAWLALGGIAWFWQGSEHGLLLLTLLLLALFAVGGSLGGVALADALGATIPVAWRGRLFGTRQLLGSLAALGAGVLARRVLADPTLSFPANYGILFLLAGVGLAIAGLGFAALSEPRPRQPVRSYGRGGFFGYLRSVQALWAKDGALRQLVYVYVLSGFHLALIPFYVVFAQQRLGAGAGEVGTFLMLQVLGGVVAALGWGYLRDRRGSMLLLRICLAAGSTLPLLALGLGWWAPQAYGIVFFLLGATLQNQRMAFPNLVIDIAPEGQRASYQAIQGTFSSPKLVLPLALGGLVGVLGFEAVFLGVAAILIATALYVRRRADLTRAAYRGGP